MNEITKRMLWGSWLQHYAAGVDPDEDLEPGVVEVLEDCFAGMSRVLAAISKTSCFDKYYPSLSMDTIFHITATDNWQERDRFPSVHFTVLTEDRYDIRYRPGGSGESEEYKLAGAPAIEKILELIDRMTAEMETLPA